MQSIWESERPEFVFVLGRRRVGKSFVLSRFARAVGGVYYQATRRTSPEQLGYLAQVLGAHFADPALVHGSGFNSWESLLAYVIDKAASGGGGPNGRLVLVLDEFPYLVDALPALPSILQSFWDHSLRGVNLKLVLCGSHVSPMRQLEGAGQPLYGRRTARLVFQPFSASDVRGFVPSYDARDVLRTYGVFGHLPGHLALLDATRSLEANAAGLLLDPASRLSDDAQHMLDVFLGESSVHYSILDAIATGEQTWSGITRRVRRSGGALLRPIQWLETMGLVERSVPVTEPDPSKSRRAIYRIADPYVAFWYRAVAPLLHSGSLGTIEPALLWDRFVAPRLDHHMGSVFEMVARAFVRKSKTLPIEPIRVGEWWDASSTEQVDVVAIDGTGGLLVGECQWGDLTAGHLERLKKRSRRVAGELGGVRSTHLALFSGSGKVDGQVEAARDAGQVLVFGPEDVLAA